MSCYTCHKLKSDDVRLYKCNVCKSIKYCSKECQTMDWSRHKLECRNIDKCPICLQELTLNDFCQTKCKHRFHLSCLLLSYSNNMDCPYCRTNLNI